MGILLRMRVHAVKKKKIEAKCEMEEDNEKKQTTMLNFSYFISFFFTPSLSSGGEE